MAEEVARSKEVEDAMDVEQHYSGTVDVSTSGHRSNSANLYLVSTKNHPSFGQSFNLRAFQDLDINTYNQIIGNTQARNAHEGGGGEDHGAAVYITAGDKPQVYIYDPAFDPEDWPLPPSKEEIKAAKDTDTELQYTRRKLGKARMVSRVRELLNYLKKRQERPR